MLRAAVPPEIGRKRQAEAGWSATTDCDRLDDAFAELNADGLIALHNTSMTMGDGLGDVDRELAGRGRAGMTGYCFYHGQELERAVDGHGLWIAFGDLDAVADQKRAVGERVRACLERHGFRVEWDGNPEKRLAVPNLDWKRRGPHA